MKSTFSLRTIGLLTLTALLMSSCAKYEEGPAISLRSKKERVASDWKVGMALDNGEDVTSSFDQYELDLKKDGDAKLTANYSFAGVDFEIETNGTWNFEDNKEDIKFDYENDDADQTYAILLLKENEMWLREKGGDLELHLEPR